MPATVVCFFIGVRLNVFLLLVTEFESFLQDDFSVVSSGDLSVVFGFVEVDFGLFAWLGVLHVVIEAGDGVDVDEGRLRKHRYLFLALFVLQLHQRGRLSALVRLNVDVSAHLVDFLLPVLFLLVLLLPFVVVVHLLVELHGPLLLVPQDFLAGVAVEVGTLGHITDLELLTLLDAIRSLTLFGRKVFGCIGNLM